MEWIGTDRWVRWWPLDENNSLICHYSDNSAVPGGCMVARSVHGHNFRLVNWCII